MMTPPFQIRRGPEEYLLCWRLEDVQNQGAGTAAAVRFHDETDALYFLRSVISDSGLMQDLRLWLLGENRSFLMYAIEDADLMAQTARMLAWGELAVATTGSGGGDAEAEAPAAEAAGEEGILRKGDVLAMASRTTGTTPLQDEMAHRERSAVEPEEILPPEEEKTEDETELVATVDAEPPPKLAAHAAVEEHPELPSEAEVEEHPALAAEAEAGGDHVLETETVIDVKTPELETESSTEERPVLDIDLDVHRPHDDKKD